MDNRILTTTDTGTWNTCAECCAGDDVYFRAEYHRAHELNGEGLALSFVAEAEGETFFYPVMVRRIEHVAGSPWPGDWKDIETVYGYTGPLSSTTDRSFLNRAWSAFDEWCRQERIVAEFTRFNPMSENHRLAGAATDVRRHQETVVVDLAGSEEDGWRAYPSVQRNMVRKALRNGLVASEGDVELDLSSFRAQYEENMERLSAADRYCFGEAYFRSLSSGLDGNLRLFRVMLDDREAAIGMFLTHGDRIHYHLSASNYGLRKTAPVNLLLHYASQWGRKRGFRWLHLGGGRTVKSNDSLLAFKSGISRLRLAFLVGRRVHNRGVYDALCSAWMEHFNVGTRPGYFQMYRLERPT